MSKFTGNTKRSEFITKFLELALLFDKSEGISAIVIRDQILNHVRNYEWYLCEDCGYNKKYSNKRKGE